jgi:DNA adenine methylase
LQPTEAVLNDRSKELIDSYEAVRTNPNAIIRYLKELKTTQAAYYAIRANRSTGYVKRASELIFLNKLCWNGLYRVNSDGDFNVPYGAPKNTKNIFDYENIRACSRALSRARLMSTDFESAVEMAKPGDFVFLDPPYVTKHNNNGFRDWNETLFSWNDQQRLARLAKRLKRAGTHVVVCNAFHRDIINMYDGFRSKIIERSTTLASDATFRGTVSEVILFA